jgi:hypothetical protein
MARPEITGKKIQRWFSKSQLAARYNVCTRSIERWVKGGKFPLGVRMPNGRWAWSDVTIELHERALVSSRQLPSTEAPAQASTAA